jgi:hypothetical protein
MGTVAALLGGTGRHQLHHQTTTRTPSTPPRAFSNIGASLAEDVGATRAGGGAFPSSGYWLWWRSLSVWLIRICWRFLRLHQPGDHIIFSGKPDPGVPPLSFEVPVTESGHV